MQELVPAVQSAGRPLTIDDLRLTNLSERRQVSLKIGRQGHALSIQVVDLRQSMLLGLRAVLDERAPLSCQVRANWLMRRLQRVDDLCEPRFFCLTSLAYVGCGLSAG